MDVVTGQVALKSIEATGDWYFLKEMRSRFEAQADLFEKRTPSRAGEALAEPKRPLDLGLER